MTQQPDPELQSSLDALVREAELEEEAEPVTESPGLGQRVPIQISPTLHGLEADRRPKARTVCETCPNSIWFTSPTEVQCYCRVMFLITWRSSKPNQLTDCDGLYLNQEE